MSISNVYQIILLCISCIPIAVLFLEAKKRWGKKSASAIVVAFVVVCALGAIAIESIGIWVVLLFPLLLLVMFAVRHKKSKNDSIDT
jgi:hypothetical protein